jgi:hypothetical protein
MTFWITLIVDFFHHLVQGRAAFYNTRAIWKLKNLALATNK